MAALPVTLWKHPASPRLGISRCRGNSAHGQRYCLRSSLADTTSNSGESGTRLGTDHGVEDCINQGGIPEDLNEDEAPECIHILSIIEISLNHLSIIGDAN